MAVTETTPSSAVANASKSARVAAANTTNATSVKAAPGIVNSVNIFNASAAKSYLKLYDKASAPTVGSDTPIATIGIGAGLPRDVTFPGGLPFLLGIAYATTTGIADSDATAVALNDLHGVITYK